MPTRPTFVLFDVICRNLHEQSFEKRPVTVVVLGSRDTVLEATVTDLGADSIRWGARPVAARKLSISDRRTEFSVWVSPAGRMLRLTQPEAGLRVERDAPPVRRVRLPRRGG